MNLGNDRSQTGSASGPTTRLTPRQERFCHHYVHHPNAAGGAREAGYEARWAKQQGRRLLATGRIQARIREIHARMAEFHGRNTDSLIGKLEVVYRRALEDHQFYAAARAVELQAKLSGLSAINPGAVIQSPPVEGRLESRPEAAVLSIFPPARFPEND